MDGVHLPDCSRPWGWPSLGRSSPGALRMNGAPQLRLFGDLLFPKDFVAIDRTPASGNAPGQRMGGGAHQPVGEPGDIRITRRPTRLWYWPDRVSRDLVWTRTSGPAVLYGPALAWASPVRQAFYRPIARAAALHPCASRRPFLPSRAQRRCQARAFRSVDRFALGSRTQEVSTCTAVLGNRHPEAAWTTRPRRFDAFFLHLGRTPFMEFRPFASARCRGDRRSPVRFPPSTRSMPRFRSRGCLRSPSFAYRVGPTHGLDTVTLFGSTNIRNGYKNVSPVANTVAWQDAGLPRELLLVHRSLACLPDRGPSARFLQSLPGEETPAGVRFAPQRSLFPRGWRMVARRTCDERVEDCGEASRPATRVLLINEFDHDDTAGAADAFPVLP